MHAHQTHLIVVSADDMHVRRDSAEVLVCLSVAEVACAKDLLNLAWYKQLLELCRQVMYPVWNMQVTDDEDEDHGRGGKQKVKARQGRKKL